VLLKDFHYDYPPEQVAQEAIEPRDAARMLVLDRNHRAISHRIFRDLPEFFAPGDVLVLNNTKVIPARLFARKKTGGRVEVLFLKPLDASSWECLISPAKGLEVGSPLYFSYRGERVEALVAFNEPKKKSLKFPAGFSVRELMLEEGAAPLPPYIRRPEIRREDRLRYQAVFAQREGAIAAPTASLHFTEAVLQALRAKGVEILFITLHVGLGTFEPVKAERIEDHAMQTEFYEVSPEVARAIGRAKQEKRPLAAVGTTVVRALESYFADPPLLEETNLFIRPGYEFKIIDRFLTNFHQPCSTPLILTSAFAGKDFLFQAYRDALQEKYRLFSYGDCMLIL